MIKTFLIVASLQILLYSSQQIILVVAKDFNSSKAFLECYENKKSVCGTLEVNLGKNGLGWGLSEITLQQKPNEPKKQEGDKKAPAGIFHLTSVFGDAAELSLSMPYIYNKNMICVDDSNSNDYNKIIPMPINKPESFEKMSRDDHQYELGVVVAHNTRGVKNAGSCIFLHIAKSQDAPTAGCTSMTFKEIQHIVQWLDQGKNPLLVQIPRSSAKEVKKLFPQLKDSKLLN